MLKSSCVIISEIYKVIMGKKNKKKNSSQKKIQKNINPEIEIINNLEEKISEFKDEIILTDEEDSHELEAEDIIIPDKDITKVSQDLYHDLLKLKKIFDKRQEDLDSKKKEYVSKCSRVEQKEDELNILEAKLKERLEKYDKELEEVNLLRIEKGFSSILDKRIIDQYQEKFRKQEVLLNENIDKLSKKSSEYNDLITHAKLEQIKLLKERNEQFLKEKERIQDDFSQRFFEKEDELNNFENSLKDKERHLSKIERELKANEIDFEDEKEFLLEKASKKVAVAMDSLKEKLSLQIEKNKSLYDSCAKSKEKLRCLGEYKPEDLINTLKKKEKQIYELQEKIDLAPDILKIDELKKLRKERTEWNEKISRLNSDKNNYKSRYELQKLDIGEKERLVFQNEELEQRIGLQKVALEELKDEVNNLTQKTDEKVTFSSCSEMDKKFKNSPTDLSHKKINESWINDIQQAIAIVTANRLYYDLDTIRSFVSGLSMSKFSILQGISGTGKTSLPKAFVEAIGGNFGIVEVQSGWKDRQDLIGYYNTFEKKYYEGKFLKYIYMASTPEYKDKPFFIILDEMNLSHPEHYFADILSMMEETDQDKQILQISEKVNDIPALMLSLKEGGIGIKIPANVWFIGTANHDETTLQFAPKTYDRANILEMPKNIHHFELRSIDSRNVRISSSNLQNYFKDSIDNSDVNLDDVNNYLNKNEFKNLCNKLGIGWGNRLEKQIREFIPVYVSLGGTTSDALDHIIASKIIRTIKGRYDLQESTLNNLKDELNTNFRKKIKGKPYKSLKIINEELDKLR